MRCPFCELEGERRLLHAHLTDLHADKVETWESQTQRRYYQLTCPYCGDAHRQEVKPRLRDRTFLERYAREIRVVAFDMLLYHLEGAHEEEEQGV